MIWAILKLWGENFQRVFPDLVVDYGQEVTRAPGLTSDVVCRIYPEEVEMARMVLGNSPDTPVGYRIQIGFELTAPLTANLERALETFTSVYTEMVKSAHRVSPPQYILLEISPARLEYRGEIYVWSWRAIYTTRREMG